MATSAVETKVGKPRHAVFQARLPTLGRTPLLRAHRFFLGLPVKIEAQERGVDFEGERQGHQATCLDLVLPQVQTQQSGALCNELGHGHGPCSTQRKPGRGLNDNGAATLDHCGRAGQEREPTFAGQLGGGQTQTEHRAVGDQAVFQLVDALVAHRVMAQI